LGHLLSDLNLRLCAVFVVVFCLMPPQGLGFEMCACKRYTGAPCPGCGITRCGANLVRGDVVQAARYHPLGLLVIPTIAAFGLLAVSPRRWREAVRRRLVPAARRWRPLWWTALGGFFLFGLVRWLGVVTGVIAFPATWP
jgi:hypothetical protein